MTIEGNIGARGIDARYGFNKRTTATFPAIRWRLLYRPLVCAGSGALRLAFGWCPRTPVTELAILPARTSVGGTALFKLLW
jgi:hypothetical protein